MNEKIPSSLKPHFQCSQCSKPLAILDGNYKEIRRGFCVVCFRCLNKLESKINKCLKVLLDE